MAVLRPTVSYTMPPAPVAAIKMRMTATAVQVPEWLERVKKTAAFDARKAQKMLRPSEKREVYTPAPRGIQRGQAYGHSIRDRVLELTDNFQNKLSLASVARQLGINRRTVSRWRV